MTWLMFSKFISQIWYQLIKILQFTPMSLKINNYVALQTAQWDHPNNLSIRSATATFSWEAPLWFEDFRSATMSSPTCSDFFFPRSEGNPICEFILILKL